MLQLSVKGPRELEVTASMKDLQHTRLPAFFPLFRERDDACGVNCKDTSLHLLAFFVVLICFWPDMLCAYTEGRPRSTYKRVTGKPHTSTKAHTSFKNKKRTEIKTKKMVYG
jgi:hypothetical protein